MKLSFASWNAVESKNQQEMRNKRKPDTLCVKTSCLIRIIECHKVQKGHWEK